MQGLNKKSEKCLKELRQESDDYVSKKYLNDETLVVAIYPDFLVGKSSIYSPWQTISSIYQQIFEFYEARGVNTILYTPRGLGAPGGIFGLLSHWALVHQDLINNLKTMYFIGTILFKPVIYLVKKYNDRHVRKKMAKYASSIRHKLDISIACIKRSEVHTDWSLDLTRSQDVVASLPDLDKRLKKKFSYFILYYSVGVYNPEMFRFESSIDINKVSLKSCYKRSKELAKLYSKFGADFPRSPKWDYVRNKFYNLRYKLLKI